MMNIENQIQNTMFKKDHEKSFIDKLLNRKEVEEIKHLVRKPNLSRSELLELLYLTSATEQKLLNYDQWNRYIILKFFVWIREFITVCELWFDFNDDVEAGKVNLDSKQKKMLSTVRQQLEHNAKFLVDLYLNIGRTSLSVGATGFFELLRNKFEISYPEMKQAEAPRPSVLGLGLGK